MDWEKSFLYNETMNHLYESDDSIEDSGDDWYKELGSDDGNLCENESDSVFAFETDHAALKGNTDYHTLIKTMAVLQAQRIKTVEDIDKLEKLRYKVRNNPREYLNKLLSGDTSDIPSRIEVQQVPKIDWSKYSRKRNEVFSHDANDHTTPEQCSTPKEIETSSTLEEKWSSVTVRGRMFDQSKPQTFNQLWTAEEQLRLEELLVEFPPERNENNRWRKIAQALGNRTTKQVCSRVQKYFKKLNKVGLPIPGHQLKTNNLPSEKKKPRKPKKRMRDSTFFPTQHLVALEQLEGCEEDESKTICRPTLTADLKADIIKKVVEFKMKDAQLAPFSHPGVNCAVCAEMPLKGTRWQCLVCQNLNLCSDCVVGQLSAEDVSHPPSHPLQPLTNPTVAHWDPDYLPDSFQSTNYLDPNFITSSAI